MGNKSSTSGSQDGTGMAAAQEAFTKALMAEMNRGPPQPEIDQQEVLDRLRKLEAEVEEERARRQELEEEKKKNENSSAPRTSLNVGSGLSTLQTVIPSPQVTQSYHRQPLIQSTEGHYAGQDQHVMRQGGPMMENHQGGPGHTMMKQAGPCGPMVGTQQSGPHGQSMIGAQQGQMSHYMMGPHQGPLDPSMIMRSQQGGPMSQSMIAAQQGGPMAGTQQSGPLGQSMMGSQQGGKMSHSMMGPQQGPLGQSMMRAQAGGQMSQSMMGPQQYSLHPTVPMGPRPGFSPQPDGMTGYSPQQGPMGHPDFDPQFQPPIGRMEHQMPHNRGPFLHPYRRGQQHNNDQQTHAPSNYFQNNQGGPQSNQNQRNRRLDQTKDQPRARSNSREQNAPQKRTTNPYRQNNKVGNNTKADGSNQKSNANQGAVPKKKPSQDNAQKTKQPPKNDSGSEKSQPPKINKKVQNSKREPKSDSSSDKSQEKGVNTKKENNPLFSNKASKTNQKVEEYLNTLKTQKPQSSGGKVVLNFDDLAKLSSTNPELWDVDSLAKLFGKDEVTTKHQPNPPVPISDLAQMFEPDNDKKPVHEPKVPKPRPDLATGAQSNQKKDAGLKKITTNDVQNILEKIEKLNLLSTNESRIPIDLQKMIEKIKLPPNAELNSTVPKPRAGPTRTEPQSSQKKDVGQRKFNDEDIQKILEKITLQSNSTKESKNISDNQKAMGKVNLPSTTGPKNVGPEPQAKSYNKTRPGGIKKKQVQHKKRVLQTSDDSIDSDDLSDPDSDFSSVSRDSFKTALGTKQPDQADGVPRKPFQKNLTPAALPPLCKMNRGARGFLNLFIDKKIPSRREALAMGVKLGQLYRKVQDVVVRDGTIFDFPTTIMGIIEFGEKHPDARANFVSDILAKND